MNKKIFQFILVIITFIFYGLSNRVNFNKESVICTDKIEWYSLEEASKIAEKTGKKIIVDVYTNWCGWCKIMDQKTFSNQEVIEYIKQKYVAVKLNAETQDSIVYKGVKFGYNPQKRANQLAYLLLNGKMSYPTTVILNEKSEILTPIAGFIEPQVMLKVLKYYGENKFLEMKWEDYEKMN